MWFDVQAALAEIEAQPKGAKSRPNPPADAIRAICAIQPAPETPEIAQVARIARPRPAEPENAPAASAPAEPAGLMLVTWTGRLVHPHEWAALSDWDRHGPQGCLFCGKCWRWQDRDTALECLDGGTCR